MLGNDCVWEKQLGGMLGAVSTVKCWNHLVVDMNDSVMLPRGAAVVGAMGWTKGRLEQG